MLTWDQIRDGLLANADATAQVAVGISALAQELREADDWKARPVVEAAMADDPTALALLQRNINAHRMMAEALADFRQAMIQRHAAAPRPSVPPGGPHA